LSARSAANLSVIAASLSMLVYGIAFESHTYPRSDNLEEVTLSGFDFIEVASRDGLRTVEDVGACVHGLPPAPPAGEVALPGDALLPGDAGAPKEPVTNKPPPKDAPVVKPQTSQEDCFT